MKLEAYSAPITGHSYLCKSIPKALLKRVNNKKLFRYALEEWGVLGLSFAGLFFAPIWLKILCLVVFAGRLHALGVIIHDLAHQNLRKKTALMRIVEVMTGYLIGTTANAMAYHHNRHHRYAHTFKDPYFRLNKKCSFFKRIMMSIFKGSLLSYAWIARSAFAPLAHFFPGLRTVYGRIFLQDISGKDLGHHPEVLICIKEDYGLLVFHILLLSLAFSFFPLLQVYYLCLPLAGIFCIYRLLIEHEYEIQDSLKISRTFDHHNSWPWRLFLTPRHIGYHIAHHLHPTVALEDLPQVRKWYLANLPEAYK